MRFFAPLSLIALSLALGASPAAAQYAGRAGAYEQDPAFMVPRVAPGVAGLVVRHGGDLQLSQKQLDAIEVIRQHQDSVSEPWLRTLDSLRNGPRPVNPRDLSQEQREALARQQAAVKTALTAIHEANAEARAKVMAILTLDQQQKAGQLENAAKELARARSEERPLYDDGSGYQRRRNGPPLTLFPGA